MAIQIAPGFTGGNGQAPDQTEVDRRFLQLEAQLLDAAGLRKIPPPTYLINNWLIQDSLAWISGKPGDGKSFIALDMACAVATGLPWQGHTVTQGTVLYLAAEGAAGLSIRLDAWMTINHHPDEDNLNFLPVPVKMIDTDHVDIQALSQLLQIIRPTLVIIDTQARVTTGLEENSSKDMGRFVDALETLRAAQPATYLVVHHTPRNGDNLRGSTALEGAAETIVRAVKDGDLVTLECQKQKNAAPPEDLDMYMQPQGASVILSFEASGVIDHTTPSQDQLLEQLRKSFGTDDDLTHTQIMKVSPLKSTVYYETLKRLVERGKLLKRREGKRVFYRLPEDDHSGNFGITPGTSAGGPNNNSVTSATPLGAGVNGVIAKTSLDRHAPCPKCGQSFDDSTDNDECRDWHYEE